MSKVKTFSLIKAKKNLPKRSSHDNKTAGGKCLVIAGSQQMLGASILTATAAARTGAGYTYLISEVDRFDFQKNPDFIFLGSLNQKFAKIDLTHFSSVAIGPGMTNKKWIAKILVRLYKMNFSNVVIDASALSVVASEKLKLKSSWILTPHEGELAKLLSSSSVSIRHDRLSAVKQAQEKFKCLILLKGPKTLVSDNKQILQIAAGNPSLAKAGTGDVLTGIIAGLLSQKVPPLQAACLGAFIHGMCAKIWIKSGNDPLSLLASDLLIAIPQVLAKIRKLLATKN